MWKQKLRQWSKQQSTARVCEDRKTLYVSGTPSEAGPVMRIHLRGGMKAGRHAPISVGIVTKTCSVVRWWRRGVESPKFNNGVNVGKNPQVLEPTSKNYQLKYPTANGSHGLEFCWRVHMGHQYRSENQTHGWTCCFSFSFAFYFSLRVCFPSKKVF